jgi:iron complex transport system permease protein
MRSEIARAPGLRSLALLGASAAVALLSVLLSFRLPLAAADVSLHANGARMLLAAGVGMGLAVSGSLRAAVGGSPLREAYLFAVSTGAATGVALGLKGAGGAVAGSLGGLLGAALFAGSVALTDGRRRAGNLALGALMLAMLASAVVATGAGATEEAGFGGAVAWLLGDVSRARTLGGLAVLAVVAALVAAAARRARDLPVGPLGDGAARGRADLSLLSALLLGVAVGAGGLVAFIGLFAPLSVRAFLDRRAGAPGQLWLCGAVGAAFVMAADALPRYAVGGYALPLNVSIAIAAVPAFLWWNRRRLRRQSARAAGRVFEAIEATAIAASAAVLVFVAYAYTSLVRALA